ncbi:uncharacterized protein LOC135256081 [Anguilla rostrata]|uniref:uncharacterized protein LOC135256081 n=1 Tax=Anguilla rostrata TaxID=7938 RepID=UPI0030D271E7
MIGILFLIIHTCAYLVHAGGSGSAEAAAAVNPGMMNAGVGAEAANPGGLNNLLLNGQAQLAQLVPVPSTFFVQQPGLPIGQVGVPAGSNMALQQGANTQLFAIVPVNNVGGQQIPGLQVPGLPMFNQAQQFQIVPVGGRNMMLPGMGAQTALGHNGHNVKRSVPEEPTPETAPSEMQEISTVSTTPSSLAEALKLPLFPFKVNPADPECSEDEPAVPETEKVTMEESSGLGEISWSEMTPIA